MARIFGIPDRSRPLSLGFVLVTALVIIPVVLLHFVFNVDLTMVFKGWAWFVLGFCVLAALCVLVLLIPRAHQANRIMDLMSAGKIEEACREGLGLMEKTPDDPLIRINTVAAHHRAGKFEDARRLLGELNPERLPKVVRVAFEDWQAKLSK